MLEAAQEILEDRFMRATEGDDFIGVQCYSRVHFGPEGQAPNEPGVPITQMGYEYWPQGVEHCARRAAAMTGIPVLLTESGIATDDDTERITYLAEVLRGVRRALDDGVDIRGYFVWSLLDNFEWSLGFGPKFGLHSVDPKTFARHPKPSAAWYRRRGPGQRPGGAPGLSAAVASPPCRWWPGSIRPRSRPRSSSATSPPGRWSVPGGPLTRSPRHPGANRHPSAWWAALVAAMATALAVGRPEGPGRPTWWRWRWPPNSTGWWSSTVTGEVLRPAKLWNDTESAEDADRLVDRLGRDRVGRCLRKRPGGRPSPSPSWPGSAGASPRRSPGSVTSCCPTTG